MAMQSSGLWMDDVDAAYGLRPVLAGLSLHVARGEVVALLGRNGSGKSTCLKVVMGLLRHGRGSVAVRDTILDSWPVHRRSRQGIGYLMQDAMIFADLTVEENIALAAPATTASRFVDDLLAKLPGGTCRAGLLSGGQRHLLGLAMVLCRAPQLLLLDEPTAGLAPDVAAWVLQHIREHAETTQAAVLLVEQRTALALVNVDRALLLEGGRVVAETVEPASWLHSGPLNRPLATYSSSGETPRLAAARH